MYFDIKLTDNGKYYDLTIDDKGNVETTDGLDTAITLALLTNTRADESEVQESINRGGWWGNSTSEYQNSELGSKVWLLANDVPNDDTAALADTYSRQATQFLIDNGYVDGLKINTNYGKENISITIQTQIGSDISNYNLQAWSETNVTVQ